MDEAIKELLEDIAIGDRVRLLYVINDHQTEYEGVVVSISDYTIKLEKQDGRPIRLRLGNEIRSIEQVSDKISSTEEAKPRQSSPVVQPQVVSFATAGNQIMRNFVVLPPSQPFVYQKATLKSKIKELLKKSENREFVKTINSVSNSVEFAIKNHELKEKYHNSRAKILREWTNCQSDTDYEIFYSFLGMMAIDAEHFDNDAIEAFVRTKNYSLAAYAATKGERNDDADVLTLCALLSNESSEITQYISQICVAKRDTEILFRLLQMYKDDPAQCEAIAACVVQVFIASGATLRSPITPYHTAYDAASQMLEVIPTSWKVPSAALRFWERYKQYSYPSNQPCQQNEYLIGNIIKFDKQKWGFISPKPSIGANHFFYVSQVLTDSEYGILLRKALQCGKYNQLEVIYELGKSTYRPGDISATAIELSPAGAQEFLRRASSPIQSDSSPVDAGIIERFDHVKREGIIVANQAKFRFSIWNVIDPWLRAYLEQGTDIAKVDVRFDAVNMRAQAIRRPDVTENPFHDYDQFVSDEKRREWEAFVEERQKSKAAVDLDTIDPYEAIPYVELEPYKENRKNEQLVPFLWIQGSMEDRTDISRITSPYTSTSASSSQLENTPRSLIPSDLTPTMKELGRQDRESIALARKAMVEGRLEEAERAFEKALEGGRFNEAAICDYITLCMRQSERIGRAVQLLKTYGALIPSEKLLNLKISVYDKKKDYKELCILYEEAVRTAPSVWKKAHSLYRLIDAYLNLKDYRNALNACMQWEALYQQHKYSSDADKLQKGIHNVERKKAICLYHLGKKDEAKTIATSLLRINPSDTAANSIMSDSLSEYTFGAEEINEVAEDSEEANDSKLSPFVRFKIRELNLASVLKSPNIRDGKYIGSEVDRRREIDELLQRRKLSSQSRSDSLFAACKILDQTGEQGSGSKESSRKYRYAGRAMAAWGDSMVAQTHQLDTTRMAYLYALKTLTPTEAGPEQGWIDAYNRYIKSFFLAQQGANSLDEYVNEQNNRRDRDAANTDIFVDHTIPDVLMRDYLCGILLLVNAIENQQSRQNTFLNDLYNRNIELRKSVCAQLSLFIESSLPSPITRTQFCDAMKNAARVLKQRVEQFNSRIAEISSVLLLQPLSITQLDELEPERWSRYLTATDNTRLSTIYYRIVRRSQDFYGSGEFDSRAECIRAILLEVDKLQENIYKEPTDISYDILLPALNQMKIRLLEKQDELYQVYLPKITIEETIPPFRSPNGDVQIHFTVRNDLNYQAAESFQIVEISGQDVLRSVESQTIQLLRGGEEEEVSVTVKLSENANAAGSFTAKVSFSYKFSDAPQSISTKYQDVEMTFIIRSEDFHPFSNPFAAYEEHIMEDEAMFFGREEMANRIIDKIQTPDGKMNYGGAVALYGQTRTGKSSLLYHLQNKLLQKYGDDVVIWDMGNLGDQEVSSAYLNNFYYTMLEVGHESILDNESLREIVLGIGLEPPLDAILQSEGSASTLFNSYMRKLNAILRDKNKIIVLILDEFTYLHSYIKKGLLPEHFMHAWKALLEKNCIFAVIAGQDDMPEFVRENQNDFGVVELIKLNYLAERDAKDLIQKPLESRNSRNDLFRDDGGVDELYSLTAGSAYLTIILCSKLVSYLNEKGASTITKGIINDFIHTHVLGPNSFLLDKHFEPQVQERGREELTPINAELLLSIARQSKMAGYARLDDITCGNMPKEEIVPYLERLVDRNVLLREGRDGYRIYVKLLQKWLIDTRGA